MLFAVAQALRAFPLINASVQGEALIVRYTERFVDALAAIDGRDLDSRAKLVAYVDLYVEVLS